MRASLMSVAFVLLSVGCVDPLPGDCENDADCGEGQFCDPEIKSCFAKEERCEPACADHQQCVSQACSNRYSAVVITSPQDGRGFAPDATVTVTADLTLASDRLAKDPGSLILEVTAPGGTKTTQPMAKVGEAYEAAVQLGASGTYELVARYEAAGLSSTKVSVSVDTTGPNLVVTYEAAPTRPAPDGGTTWTDQDTAYLTAFRRDETLKLQITSLDEDVDGDSVELTVQFPNSEAMTVPVASQPVDACGTSSGYCGQATVDLSKPVMNAFRSDLAVTVNGKDLAGNVAAAAVPSTPVKVTRWKWAHQVDSNPVRASPAIASDGTVLVGSSNGATGGRFVAVSPSGDFRWAKDLGAVTASPAVGQTNGDTEPVYVAANGSTKGVLYALSAATGAELQKCSPSTPGDALASIGISSTTFTGETEAVETATTVVNGTTSKNVFSIRPNGASKCRDFPSGGNATYPAAISGTGQDVFFADALGALRGFTFTNLGWDVKPGWPVDPAGTLSVKSLAVSEGNLIGGGEANQGGVFSVPSTGNVTAPVWEYKTASQSWNVTVGNAGVAWVGVDDGTLLKIAVGNSSTATSTAVNGIDVVQAAPLLAQGNMLYVADVTGTVAAINRNSPDTPVWTVAMGDASYSSPNIDCKRAANGTKEPGPGVLYVGSNAGELHAFIVDSSGIDTDAPWPKYQRDPRNTGNSDTNLNDFACP